MIPVIINNYNQLEFLLPMIAKLGTFDNIKIIILDNGSTYKPLLDWYSTIETEIEVVRTINLGHHAPWISGVVDKCRKDFGDFYIVTDPDIDISDLPENTIDVLKDILIKKNILKVGLSLRIDDIPDHYKLKNSVLRWEGKYWNNPEYINGYPIYNAGVDTTFALYNHKNINQNFIFSAVRIGGTLTAKHLTWYIDENNLTDNQKYYIDICSKSKHREVASWTYWASQNKEYANGKG